MSLPDSSVSLAPLPQDDGVLIRRADLPRYLPIARQTLARWATEGKGPIFVKVGRMVAYRAGDVRRWLNDHTKQMNSSISVG